MIVVKAADDAHVAALVAAHSQLVLRFVARWSSACKKTCPGFENFSDEVKGSAVPVLVDVDTCENSTRVYGIKDIPTHVVIKNGKLVCAWRCVLDRGDYVWEEIARPE